MYVEEGGLAWLLDFFLFFRASDFPTCLDSSTRSYLSLMCTAREGVGRKSVHLQTSDRVLEVLWYNV